jgi:MFS family permease
VYELIPIVAGIAVGLLGLRLHGGRLRWIIAGGALAGAALVAGLASGELAESWLFFLWDLAQGVTAAALTATLVSWRRAHRASA